MAPRQSCWTYSARSLATAQNASAVAHLFRLWIGDSFEIEDAHNIERYNSVKRLYWLTGSSLRRSVMFIARERMPLRRRSQERGVSRRVPVELEIPTTKWV